MWVMCFVNLLQMFIASESQNSVPCSIAGQPFCYHSQVSVINNWLRPLLFPRSVPYICWVFTCLLRLMSNLILTDKDFNGLKENINSKKLLKGVIKSSTLQSIKNNLYASAAASWYYDLKSLLPWYSSLTLPPPFSSFQLTGSLQCAQLSFPALTLRVGWSIGNLPLQKNDRISRWG